MAPRIARVVSTAKQVRPGRSARFHRLVRKTGSEAAQYGAACGVSQPARGERGARSVPPAPMDFHAAVAALGDYPVLLRRLGLVIDLEVRSPASASPVKAPADVCRSSRIHRRSLSGINTPVSPPISSRATISSLRRRIPRRRRPTRAPIPCRIADLQKAGQYEPIQVDLDGAGLKAINMVAGDVGAAPSRTLPPRRGAALRTSGCGFRAQNHPARCTAVSACKRQPAHVESSTRHAITCSTKTCPRLPLRRVRFRNRDSGIRCTSARDATGEWSAASAASSPRPALVCRTAGCRRLRRRNVRRRR